MVTGEVGLSSNYTEGQSRKQADKLVTDIELASFNTRFYPSSHVIKETSYCRVGPFYGPLSLIWDSGAFRHILKWSRTVRESDKKHLCVAVTKSMQWFI